MRNMFWAHSTLGPMPGLECFSMDFPSSYLIALMEQGSEKSLWNVHRRVKNRLANIGHQNEGLKQTDLG